MSIFVNLMLFSHAAHLDFLKSFIPSRSHTYSIDRFMPNEPILNNATEKPGEVLGYLARKKEGMLSDFRYEDDREIVREAELGLKEHLEMLPRLDESGNVISWPPKALKYLRKDYKLIDRRKFDIGTIRFGPVHNPWRPHRNLG